MLKEAMASVAIQKFQCETIIVAKGEGQSEKINLGVMQAKSDYLAILHDDDMWHPQFLLHALPLLEEYDFVSASQLELDEAGQVIQISDFACPSGWIMRREVWTKVGDFDKSYKWHPDTDWLGRLELGAKKRAHLVDRYAPVQFINVKSSPCYNQMANRPSLRSLLMFAKPQPTLVYTALAEQLVIRRQHADAIMRRREADATIACESQWEHGRMVNRYNRVPW
jgi:glycosyltransferase involved in cell wall biosynthesis